MSVRANRDDNAGARILRVVHILGELRPSGAEVMLECTGKLWREVGVSPAIIAWGDTQGPHADALASAGYTVAHVRFRRSIGSLLRLVRCARTLDPDVVHVHAERMSLWALLACRLLLRDVGLLRTVHNAFPYEGALRRRRRRQRRLLGHLGVVHVAVSPTVHANEAERFQTACDLIWNWVDVDTLARAGVRSDHRTDTQIAMIGNCSSWKRHDLGLRAFALLARSGTRLVHAGLEDQSFPERQLAEQLGVGRDVVFVGHVRDVPAMLVETDLLLMPSSREGLGLVVGEAIVAGVPVVAANAPGLRDYAWSSLVRLFDDTPAALADGMREVLDCPPSVAERLTASAEAQARLSPGRGVAEYHAVYSRIVRRRGGRLA